MSKSPSQLLNWLIPFCLCFLIAPCCSADLLSSAEASPDQQHISGEDALEEAADSDAPTGLEDCLLGRRIRLNGLVEFAAEYLDLDDLEDPDRGDSSDFFISTLELALHLDFNAWSSAKVVVSAEDLGMNGEEGRVIMNEAMMALTAPWFPVTLIAGRTEMPFGEFEDHLIEGTLTEEIYEIDDLGIILAFQPDLFGLDLSAAVYQAPQIIDNLTDFDVHEETEDRSDDPQFAAYIFRLAAEPLEDVLQGSLSYNSEPGDGRRNQSIGGALELCLWRFSVDLELITALTREDGEDGRENRETAWIAGLAVDLTEQVEMAVRYEAFDDDQPDDQEEVLFERMIAGFNYTPLDWAVCSLEYRLSNYENERGSDTADRQHMLLLQVALEY